MFRVAAITSINLCLYGAGCVFIVLIASFVKNIFDEAGVEVRFVKIKKIHIFQKSYLNFVQLNFGLWMVIVAAVMIPPCWLGTPNDFW